MARSLHAGTAAQLSVGSAPDDLLSSAEKSKGNSSKDKYLPSSVDVSEPQKLQVHHPRSFSDIWMWNTVKKKYAQHQGHVAWHFEQPGLLEGVPAHGRGVGTLRCLPTQTILWFYDQTAIFMIVTSLCLPCAKHLHTEKQILSKSTSTYFTGNLKTLEDHFSKI